MSKDFNSADRTDEEYYAAMAQAYIWYREGKLHSSSSGICGATTAGYGELDEYGYFEFPLDVTFKDGIIWVNEELTD